MKLRSDLVLLPLDDGTVVFSEQAQCLTGLNAAATFITQLLQDGVPESELADALADEGVATPDVAAQWIKTSLEVLAAHGLLEGSKPPETPPSELKDQARLTSLKTIVPAYAPLEAVAERRYRLLNIVMQVRFSLERQVDWVDAVIGHLATDDEAPATMTLDIHNLAQGEDRFGADIYIDCQFFARVTRLFNMGPMVKSALWLSAVNAYDFQFNFHSGVVGNGETCVLLPAAAGSGKSSLTAALTHRGYRYFSDEVALLESGTFKVVPVPLALCTKSTGWDIVAGLFPDIMNKPIHHRTDGKKVRYYPVPDSVTAKISLPVSHVIFPRYEAGAQTELKPLARSEALRSLMEECQALRRTLDPVLAADFVRWIAGIDCYTLVFSSLDEAADLVETVLPKGKEMVSGDKWPDAVSASIRRGAKAFDTMAATYGSDTNKLLHAIPKELEELYRQDLEEVLGAFTAFESVLEVGAGNGIFTRLLDRWGCKGIVGTDISNNMRSAAQARLPQCRFELVTKEADPDLFPPATFDLIISRQFVCHTIDPIAVFECWKKWLKPGGRIAVIDGLWTRSDWGPPWSQTGVLVDDRPLSCTQTPATVVYLLSRTNLAVKHCRALNRVNGFAKAKYEIGQGREPVVRFVVVASAEFSP